MANPLFTLSSFSPDTGLDLKVTGKISFMNAHSLELNYCVSGSDKEINTLVWPSLASAPERTDQLWGSTCLELFLSPSNKPTKSSSYYEINISPSGHWASYHFDSYREGMTIAPEIYLEQFTVLKTSSGYSVQAIFKVPFSMPNNSRDSELSIMSSHNRINKSWKCNIAAVLQYRLSADLNVNKSQKKPKIEDNFYYYAMTHPFCKPDFHHPDSFVVML